MRMFRRHDQKPVSNTRLSCLGFPGLSVGTTFPRRSFCKGATHHSPGSVPLRIDQLPQAPPPSQMTVQMGLLLWIAPMYGKKAPYVYSRQVTMNDEKNNRKRRFHHVLSCKILLPICRRRFPSRYIQLLRQDSMTWNESIVLPLRQLS